MVNVIISGYFDPLHVGHLELIQKAKVLGDKLIVIVNNDNQTELKKGKVFMPEEERVKIVQAIKGLDEVFLSIDEDRSVCKSIEKVHEIYGIDIFANGGDRLNNEIPEAKICKELGIEIVDGLGDKIQGSSDLIKKSEEKE